MTDIRVALIGYGLAGSVFHAPLISCTPGLKLATIVTTRNDERARADYPAAQIVATADDLWPLKGDLDLVVIASPNRTHFPLARRALDEGLDVVIDKPMAATLAEAEALLEHSEKCKRTLSVFHNRRWDNDFLTVQKLLKDGALGEVFRFESRFERFRPDADLDRWRESPEEAGGILFDLGSHLIDQAITLFGIPTGVYAEMNCRRRGVEVDDDSFVALSFGNGIRAHLWMSAVVPISAPRFRIVASKGGYEKFGLDPQEMGLRQGERPGAPTWGREPESEWGRLRLVGNTKADRKFETVSGGYERYYAMLRDALKGEGPLPVTGREALETMRVIAKALEFG